MLMAFERPLWAKPVAQNRWENRTHQMTHDPAGIGYPHTVGIQNATNQHGVATDSKNNHERQGHVLLLKVQSEEVLGLSLFSKPQTGTFLRVSSKLIILFTLSAVGLVILKKA